MLGGYSVSPPILSLFASFFFPLLMKINSHYSDKFQFLWQKYLSIAGGGVVYYYYLALAATFKDE